MEKLRTRDTTWQGSGRILSRSSGFKPYNLLISKYCRKQEFALKKKKLVTVFILTLMVWNVLHQIQATLLSSTFTTWPWGNQALLLFLHPGSSESFSVFFFFWRKFWRKYMSCPLVPCSSWSPLRFPASQMLLGFRICLASRYITVTLGTHPQCDYPKKWQN